MKVTVIKSFPYGADGIHVVQTVIGDELDISDDILPGLVKEGFVACSKVNDEKSLVRRSRLRTAG